MGLGLTLSDDVISCPFFRYAFPDGGFFPTPVVSKPMHRQTLISSVGYSKTITR